MISLPARAIEVNFLDQKWQSEAKKLTFRTEFALIGMKTAQKVFLINDQLAGLSSMKKEFYGSKTILSQETFPISRMNRFRRAFGK